MIWYRYRWDYYSFILSLHYYQVNSPKLLLFLLDFYLGTSLSRWSCFSIDFGAYPSKIFIINFTFYIFTIDFTYSSY